MWLGLGNVLITPPSKVQQLLFQQGLGAVLMLGFMDQFMNGAPKM
jgi:hypothetical protein